MATVAVIIGAIMAMATKGLTMENAIMAIVIKDLTMANATIITAIGSATK